MALLLVPQFEILDMAGPVSVFQTASEHLKERHKKGYQIILVSELGGQVPSSSGIEVWTQPWSEKQASTTLLIGGFGARQAKAASPDMICHLLEQAKAKRRIASVCTGAFLLAQAGLLNGRRVTTHWRYAAALQRQFPLLKVEGDRIFVRDGDLWTSAGVAAGIDLALAMVEVDFGVEIAAKTAREIVVHHRRIGGQSQFSALQDLTSQNGRVRNLLAYVAEHPTDDLDIEQLAGLACVSPRQLIRLFKAETGQTPAKAVERIRAESARLQIEEGESSIERVAATAGFVDAERMRRAFVRLYGNSPQALRRQARKMSAVSTNVS